MNSRLLRRPLSFARRCQCLIEIPQNVLNFFDAHGEADHVVADATSAFFVVAQLLVRRRRRMYPQTLGIADVSQMRKKLQAFDETLAGLEPAANAEAHDGARSLRKIFLRQRIITAGGQAGIIHPCYPRVAGKKARDFQRVAGMTVHAQLERFKTLQKQKRVEWAEGGAKVAQAFHASLHDVGEVAEGFVKADTVITLTGLQHLRKRAAIP